MSMVDKEVDCCVAIYIVCICRYLNCFSDVVACIFFFFSSRRRHTRLVSDWSSDVCSSDLCARASRRTRRGGPGGQGVGGGYFSITVPSTIRTAAPTASLGSWSCDTVVSVPLSKRTLMS